MSLEVSENEENVPDQPQIATGRKNRSQIVTGSQRHREIDRKLLEHDDALIIIWNKLKPLLNPPPSPPKRRIGF
jgi:hypothetical protein